ncbi:DUF2141 domain-containing protein [Flagellimonas halotolerans]|uniref:DUF2141 domain-containing protein n=1 Tax=Flagellimonas halotolerans TaxID=3112164 RepID=A0ABU6ILX4_9FLAO|nr:MULTISPECIES: DUF2141 domain-containing protein [unclassified Allomuricauda]MEC3964161.1 DUF2141 domain-containing protein [Muricauda sp. SYSU M86414]MEC4264031.1 DUF2141 domain-containing protein [Muricauda sp. SYSU M84420]
MRILLIALFLAPWSIFSQNNISVHVHNVASDKGHINVAVYNSDATFLSFDRVFKAGREAAHEGIVQLMIEDLPAGKYALAVFHDENGNGKLDTNWLGVPKEKVAFSKGKMKTFGPPKYNECAFQIHSDYEIDVKL